MAGDPLLINRQNPQPGAQGAPGRARSAPSGTGASSGSDHVSTKGATFEFSAQIGNLNRKIEERSAVSRKFVPVRAQTEEIEALYKQAKEFGPRLFASRSKPLDTDETHAFNSLLKEIDDQSYDGAVAEEEAVIGLAEDLKPDAAKALEVYSVEEMSPAVRNVPQLSPGSLKASDAARYIKAIDDALEVAEKRREAIGAIERQATNGGFRTEFRMTEDALQSAKEVGQAVRTGGFLLSTEQSTPLLRDLLGP